MKRTDPPPPVRRAVVDSFPMIRSNGCLRRFPSGRGGAVLVGVSSYSGSHHHGNSHAATPRIRRTRALKAVGVAMSGRPIDASSRAPRGVERAGRFSDPPGRPEKWEARCLIRARLRPERARRGMRGSGSLGGRQGLGGGGRGGLDPEEAANAVEFLAGLVVDDDLASLGDRARTVTLTPSRRCSALQSR